MMKWCLFLSAIAFCGCTSQLTQAGQAVRLESSITPEEKAVHDDLGDVVLSQPSEFPGDEDNARDQLRNYAARNGADIVVIWAEGREPCELNKKTNCVFIKGRAYRKK